MSEYEVYAVKYGTMEGKRSNFFMAKDIHDGPMGLDFFVWVVRGEAGTFVIDTGFEEQTAARRGREIWRPVGEGLKTLDVQADEVSDVVLTHMHYDHAGNHDLFPRARYHLQEKEMAYATGPCMCHATLRHTFEVTDVQNMVQRVFEGRVCFHDGSREIAPGLSLHWVGGHSRGLQVVRVKTRRGWVVLASDATHFYDNFLQGVPFPIVVDVADMLAGFDTLRELASSDAHVIPGHDPLVMARYPQVAEGVVRLDADPIA
ncbi:N-acyl homoserine lactonase family protein [Pseudooceanicola sp.]|uniref:N-acyl homoserine lactonase family protein n=1 Tax=Pseudooceanicola sp. TaxID=1914328 RepID=UPI0035C6B4B8